MPEREPAPEPEPEPEQLAAGICQHKARESVAPNEVVHWNVAKVSRWLDGTFGDPGLARCAFEQQVTGAQMVRLDSELWAALGQPRRALRQKVEWRVRQMQAEQRGQLRAKIGAAGRKPRSAASEAASPRSPSRGARTVAPAQETRAAAAVAPQDQDLGADQEPCT